MAFFLFGFSDSWASGLYDSIVPPLTTCATQPGCYPIAAALLAYGSVKPTKISAVGALAATGVDVSGAISLAFGEQGIASIGCTMQAFAPDETTYVGTKGSIRLLKSGHSPTRLILNQKSGGRGEFTTTVFEHPLPTLTPPTALIFPNSEGFTYEAKRVEECIAAGLTECPEYTLAETLAVMETMDEIRRQLGVKYETD
eukprot:m.899177 g.899177  ORF g.899177 m.899177 type:complete len:199 (-) comp60030_c0_seq1:5158-5754(-)